MELNKNKLFPITGKVQTYAWGGGNYLASLLQFTPQPQGKYAEFWLGTHQQGVASLALTEKEIVPLDGYIAAFPDQTLGPRVKGEFGKMPYLLKILDVKDMLSIQVHPSRASARIAFEKENAAAVPLNAPTRNYKDDNHKPELMLALSEFWLLHGFKTADQLVSTLHAVPELRFLLPVFDGNKYQEIYRTVMEMPQALVNQHLQALLDRIIPMYQADRLSKDGEDFWAARAALTYNQGSDIDRGIFSIYLFNVLHVHPGQSLFQDAGLPHAYLEGQNVEIMANSDNVLRGGLTPKHVDVKELLGHIKFKPTVPEFVMEKKIQDGLSVFPTPAPDFELGRILLDRGGKIRLSAGSAEIFLLLKGAVRVSENLENEFNRHKGEAWISFYQGIQYLTALEESVLYRASVPYTG